MSKKIFKIIGINFDIYVVFILIIEFDNDRLYLEKKTPKTADGDSYIQHHTWREIFATRNKLGRTEPGTHIMSVVKKYCHVLFLFVFEPLHFNQFWSVFCIEIDSRKLCQPCSTTFPFPKDKILFFFSEI